MSVSVDLNNTERVMYQGNNHVKCIYGPNNQLLWSEEEYFTVECTASGDLTFIINGSGGTSCTFYYWKNTIPNAARDNYTGTITTSTTAQNISMSVGDKIRLYRAENTALSGGENTWNTRIYNSSGTEFKVYGNIASLIGYTSTLPDYAFRYLFYNTGIVDASGLILPWNTLSVGCYMRMFYANYKLLTVPALPAMNLANDCYRLMFRECTKITSIADMYFKDVDGTTGNTTFYCMYQLCTGLTSIVLPEMTFSNGGRCWGMFWGCSGLTSAEVKVPENYTIPNYAYRQLFTSCTNLTNIECLATSFNTNSFNDWLSSASATGTFTKASGVTWPSGVSGIPSGWTVIEE